MKNNEEKHSGDTSLNWKCLFLAVYPEQCCRGVWKSTVLFHESGETLLGALHVLLFCFVPVPVGLCGVISVLLLLSVVLSASRAPPGVAVPAPVQTVILWLLRSRLLWPCCPPWDVPGSWPTLLCPPCVPSGWAVLTLPVCHVLAHTFAPCQVL